MTGLLIKELMARGALQRCLIVCPGSLVEQWQDELDQRFHLPFDIMTNDAVEAARTGNWFSEKNYLSERIRALLGRPEAVAIIHGGIGREDRAKFTRVCSRNSTKNGSPWAGRFSTS